MYIIYNLYLRFTTGTMNELTITTVGLEDFFYGYRLSDGSVVNVRIMDTGGQERFNSINEKFYKQADCCLLVYDVTSEKSFERIKNYYIKTIKQNCSSISKVLLLGNKTDLKEQRKISPKEGADLAQKNGYYFMESSCVDNYNVSDAFTTLIEMINNELFKTDYKKNNIKLKSEKNDNNNKVKVKKKKC